MIDGLLLLSFYGHLDLNKDYFGVIIDCYDAIRLLLVVGAGELRIFSHRHTELP